MLKSLKLDTFTVFRAADLRFSPRLNVIIGENGTGKTHLLKAAYCGLAVGAEQGRRPNASPPSRNSLQTRLADKLMTVFRPDSLGNLVNRGSITACVELQFTDRALNLRFGLGRSSTTDTVIDLMMPTKWAEKVPVYFPTRELLTIYPNFVSVYENHYLNFEETWRDTCVLLGAPLLKGVGEKRARQVVRPLEEAMGGAVELDPLGRFYLRTGIGRLEMPLVAEGARKLAMLAQLVANGSLLDGTLFWDEPETNLNPRLIREIAPVILHLCKQGTQVFLATHSLFLLREIHILMESKEFRNIGSRVFSLQQGDGEVTVEQGDSIDDVGAIRSLDEELMQSDRYMKV